MYEYRMSGSLINLALYRYFPFAVSAFCVLYICSDRNLKLSSFSSAKLEALKWINQAESEIFFTTFINIIFSLDLAEDFPLNSAVVFSGWLHSDEN